MTNNKNDNTNKKDNKLLYMVVISFAILLSFVELNFFYFFSCYEKGLWAEKTLIIQAVGMLFVAAMTVLCKKGYEMAGFKTCIFPILLILAAGELVLFLESSFGAVFLGILLTLTGSFAGIMLFSLKVREQLSPNSTEEFKGKRKLLLWLFPGFLGTVFTCLLLAVTQKLLKEEVTDSFFAARKILLFALPVLMLLCIVLTLMFRMIRKEYYQLFTESGEQRKEEGVFWKEYPRQQLKRSSWMSLNGPWRLEGDEIMVPFPPQSFLSRYHKKVKDKLFYEKIFTLSEALKGERFLLHFDAVDQVAEVILNGKNLGKHEGGYLRFSYDVTDCIKREGENILQVRVEDRLDPCYPYGKQRKKRGGMWYTPVSGIWKSVWLEAVPQNYIEKIKITPDLRGADFEIQSQTEGFTIEVDLGEGKRITKTFTGNKGRVEIEQPELWTPTNPRLYEAVITSGKDRVETYFALRTVEIQNKDGIARVCLNNSPVFLHGILDQGYFPDGIYLPVEEKEYDRDILRMKELGINLLRKHIKVEPDYFYYACDKLGMLVMQDMVNSGPYSFIWDTALPTLGWKKKSDRTGSKGKRKQFFLEHMKNTVEQVYNHPSVIAYTIFNEGWGQFESDAMYDEMKLLDNTRLIDTTSGWFAGTKNDFDSEHIYFKAVAVEPGSRPMLMSECGGYSMVVENHHYSKYNAYGYGVSTDRESLTKDILNLYEVMILPAISKGMCGCIYTQLSDVEDEINGLYTYDRKVCKIEKEKMKAMAKRIEAECYCSQASQ